MIRTSPQNNSLHLWLELLALELNNAGKDLKKALQAIPVDIPATKANLKESLWRPIQEAMLHKKSTTDLTTKEVGDIYEVLVRHFSQVGIEVPRFPTAEETEEYYKS